MEARCVVCPLQKQHLKQRGISATPPPQWQLFGGHEVCKVWLVRFTGKAPARLGNIRQAKNNATSLVIPPPPLIHHVWPIESWARFLNATHCRSAMTCPLSVDFCLLCPVSPVCLAAHGASIPQHGYLHPSPDETQRRRHDSLASLLASS